MTLGEVTPFEPAADQKLRLTWLETVRQHAAQVTAPPEVRQALLQLRQKLKENHLEASDRRWRQALKLLKLAALTSGRQELALCELLLLEHCFGDPLTQGPLLAQLVQQVVGAAFQPPVAQEEREHTWQQLSQPLELAPPEQQCQLRLAQVRHAQQAVSQQIQGFETHRQVLLEQVALSPWLPPLPPTVLAGFVSVQRQLLQEQQALAQAQAQLEAFDPERESLKLLLGKESGSRYGMGRRKAVFWTRIAPEGPGSELDSWLPWGADGLAQDPRLAPEELTQKLAELGRRVELELSPWQHFVPVLTLDTTRLFSLLHHDEKGIQRDALIRTACYEVEDRLRALDERLRQHALSKDQQLERANPRLHAIYEQVQLRRREELTSEKYLKPPTLEEVAQAFSAWLKRVRATGLASPPPPPPRPGVRSPGNPPTSEPSPTRAGGSPRSLPPDLFASEPRG